MRKRLLQVQVFILLLIASIFDVELMWRQFKKAMKIFPALFFDWDSAKTSIYDRTRIFTVILITIAMLSALNDSSAQVTAGTATYGTFNNSSTATISYTNTSGSNKLLVAGVSAQQPGGSVTSVTYNGVALTKLGNISSTNQSRIEIWYLKSPPVGTFNLVATNSQGENGVIGVMSFSGVNLISPFGTLATAQGSGTTASATAVSEVGDLVYSVVAFNNGATNLSPGSGQTEYWDATVNSSVSGSGCTKAGAASVPMQWTSTSASWTIGAVSIKSDANPTVISKDIASGSDDAEEEGPTGVNLGPGGVYLNSSDLELVNDFQSPSSGTQVIGLRFTGLGIPQGATITNAYLTFGAIAPDSPNTNSGTTNLTFKGQAADNPPTFTTATNNISNRPTTSAAIAWSVPSWTTGTSYNSPNLSSIVQEIVNRSGWAGGNSMVFIITGTGSRSADSYDGNPANAPKLTVEYSIVPEICNNGIDDDGDGLIDCADSNCSFITNNEFDNGITDWDLYVQSGNTATRSVDNTNQLSGANSGFTNITTASGTDWHIQFVQTGKSIVAGKTYNVTFQAKAAANRNISVMLQRTVSPWPSYWYQPVALTTTGQTFSFDFQVDTTITGEVGLYFNLGESNANVWLDKISFSENCNPAENCNNSIDDDGDGLIDNDDPDCNVYLPGGVAGATLWLKANTGAGAATEGATVGNWQDLSGSGNNATTARNPGWTNPGANPPVFRKGTSALGVNFNPAIDFSGDKSLDGLGGLSTKQTFVVFKNATEGRSVIGFDDVNGGGGGAQSVFWYWSGTLQYLARNTLGNNFFMSQVNHSVPAANPLIFDCQHITSTTGNVLFNGGGASTLANAGAPPVPFTGAYRLNKTSDNQYPANGQIAEVISFNSNLSTANRQKVTSYLGLKYGITLSHNYLNSSGTTICNVSSYGNNIAGIGRDDASALYQKQSKSSNTGLQVVMGYDNTIAADNASNASEFLIDNSALVWGDNAGSVAAWTATGAPAGSQILARTWKVQETGAIGSVKIQVADNSGANGLPDEETNPVSLLVDADGNFSSGATVISMTLNGANWEANVDFTNGQYFTFGMSCTISLASTQVNVTPCYGATNGAINLSPSGGIAPYTYNWSDIGATGNLQNRTGLAAGNYNVSVTDAAACLATANFTITQPAAISLSGAVTNAVPAGSSNGAIDLTVTNGASPYAYSWSASSGGVVPSGQAGSQDLTGLVAGTYKVTVTDAGSCTSTATFNVQNSVIKQLYLTDPSQGLDRVDPVATADGTTAVSGAISMAAGGPVTVDLISVKDAYIMKNNPSNNFGLCSSLIVDRESTDLQRSLIGFDLSSIPSGATITSAELRLNCTQSGGDLTLDVYQVDASDSWTEGSACGSSGKANWTQRSSSNNWASVGVIGDPGSASPIASISNPGTGIHTWTITSLVQNWLSGTAVNNGVLIGSPDGGGNRTVTYDSRESAGSKPILRVTYTVPAAQSTTFTQTPALCSPLQMPAGGAIAVKTYLSNITGVTSSISAASTSYGYNASVANGGTLSFFHTPGTGANRLLLVSIAVGNTGVSDETAPGTVSGVTFGGTAMTLVKTVYSGNAVRSYIYSLLNPTASPSANVVISIGSKTSGVIASATTFNGVNQTTPLGTPVSFVANGTDYFVSGSISSATGELVYSTAAVDEYIGVQQGISAAAGQTELWNNSGFDWVSCASSTKLGAASVTLTYNFLDYEDGCMAAVSIKPAPALSSMPANPNISAVLKYGSTTFATLTNPAFNSSTGLLTWSQTLGSAVSIPGGEAISLIIKNNESGISFKIDYDSQTKPSKVELPVSTYIDIVSYAVYDAPYPGGNIITNAVGGTYVYPRAVVTDPFGFSDITAMNIAINPPGTTVAATSVATSGCTRTYQYTWITPFSAGTFSLPATAKEGNENTVTDVQSLNFDLCTPTIGTPVFALGATSSRCQGAGSATYSATATSSTGITYSLDAASLAAGNTISAVTGAVTYAAGWGGSTTITATASGCGGPKTATHVVNVSPTVNTPVFVLGANSSRCQGAGTVTYTATAANATGITYSLDATSLSAGNTINASTGAVTYSAGWTGTSIITASAAGCSGPKTATHTVTHTLTVTTPVFALGATSARCQGGGSVTYSASASNTTGITYSLDATSVAAGNVINASTGVVNYAAGWSGTSIITTSAAGCNGPKTATHTVTITPNGTLTFALGATSTRPGGNGNVTYTATANNGGNVSYSLDATSLAAGLTINSNTGMVNYNSGWTGTATITASVTGCGGTQTATHIAGTGNVYKQLYLSDPSQALDRVDPVATADATTASTLSISASPAGVAVDAVTNNFSSNPGSTTFSVSHTTGAGLNRLMLVGISQKNKLVNSVTYGGTPLTLVGEVISNGNARVHLYSLLNPPSGTANVVVTLSANPDKGIIVGVTTFTGVDQTTPLSSFFGTESKSAAPSISVSSSTGELLYDVVTFRNGSLTVGSGQTQRWNIDSGSEMYSGGSSKAGSSSTTMSWTGSSSQDWAIGAVSVKPAAPITDVTFTQSPTLCSPLTIKAGQPVTVTNYVSIVSGSMPASPDITAVLKYGASNIITLGSPTYSGGLLTWTGTLLSDVTVPAGQAIVLEITTAQAGVTFKIDYDSQSKPSKINLPVSTFIDISSYAVYNAAYPGGSIITSTTTGTTVYPRAVVTDPFGFSDITAMNITVTPPGSTVAATSVATSGCTRTYQYTWNTTALGGAYSLPATAKEGYENAVSDVQALSFDICSPAIGTPVFALGVSSSRCQGAGTVTYTATSTNSTGMTYSLDAASLTYGISINTATGAVTFAATAPNSVVITATATGCGGPKSSAHTVTMTPTVGTPVFTLGASSYRCQAAGTVTYTASATNSTGITYSLDAASISGGNSINAATGAVIYAAGWNGTSTVTASAAGCNGPKTAAHTVTISPSAGTPVFDLGASSTRCGTSGTYTATAANATSISYGLDATSLANGNSINPSTGVVTFSPAWMGTSTVTATATGCGSNASATHTITISAACPPIANDDAANGAGGAPITVNVLANDTDPNNNINPASITIINQPVNGLAVISNGQVVYLPNGTFEGVDQFTYQVCDLTSPTPLCAIATVVVTIDPTRIDACSDAVRRQVYYLPYPEQDTRLALIASTGSSWLPIPSNNIRTIISIKVPYPGMTLLWDHWEDGYETDPDNPVQNTSLVWGDGNPYNGIAPGYPDDVLPSGAAIVLDNTMPANPRVASNIFYDGKDKILSSGAITVTQVSGEPSIIFVQCMKTNVTPVQYFGESFTIPVGQNFNSQDFAYTALFIRASENNTTVNVDKDNNGTFETTTTLNEGQSFFVNGGVLSGATVTSSAPVGVDLHFGGIDGYSSREVPIYPATWYSDVYYTPVPSTQSPDSAVVMLYNSLNRSIDIDWYLGTSSSGTITLPAKTVKRFPLTVSSNETYKFVNPTGESFTAIEIIDSYTPGGGGNSGSTYDWAFNLISEERLTNFAAIAWAPGSVDGTANGNPVWVTPSANTTIYVKYDGDVINGGSVSPCGLHYDVSYGLNELRYKKLLDSDKDQSGLAVFTCDGTKIAAAYGEDPSLSSPASPFWDVGSTIQPFCGEKLILANDDRSYTLVGQPVTISVLKNDAGFLAVIDPATLSTLGYRQPSNGTVQVNANGTLLYTPNPGFVGLDTLEYGICSTPGNPVNIVCDRAYVIIEINDCPSPAKLNLISGQIFLDKNKDGIKNEDGTGVPGKVYLYADGNCNGVINTGELVDSVTVDDSGFYQFLRYPEKMVSDDFDGPGGTSSCASGSDGTASWATNWVDAGEGGSTGYCVSPAQSEGNTDAEIKLDGAFGYALRLDDNNVSATRTLNLSGATYAFLSFSYRRANNNLTIGENIFVQVSTNGSAFTTIYTIPGDGSSDAGYVPIYNQNISSFASPTTYIRFLTNGFVDEGDFVFIDNVTIRFLKYPQCYITKIDPASIPADYSLTTVGQHAMTAANSGICLAGYDFGLAKGSTTISGTLYNDPNGSSDGLVNGTAFGSPSGATVYAYLVDATNKIRFKTTVNSSNGTFTFSQADVNSSFTLMVSTSNLALYTIAPGSATFPAGWVSTGEAYGTNNAAGTGNEAGTPNSIISVITGTSAVSGVKIGIQQVNAGPDRFVCQSGSTTMAATSTPGTWTAQPGNPGTASILTPSSPTTTISNFSNSGDYFFLWSNNGVSDTAKVTVARDPAITADPVGFTECVGGSLAVSVTATGGTPPLSYQWQSSSDSINFTNIPGANLPGYTPPSAAAGITFYRVNITAGSSGCGNLTSAVATAVILSDPVILTQPAGFNECLGETQPLTVSAAGGVPPLAYQWQSSTDNVTFSNISGATGTTYVPSSSAPGTTYFKVIINSGGNGCGAAASGSATVIVNDPPVGNLGADTTICPGTYATLNVNVSSGTAPFSYAWDNGLGSGPSKTVSPYSTTTYSVTVTDSEGCTSTDQIVVTIGLCPEVCDNGLDDDGDGLTDCADPDCDTPAVTNVTKSNPVNCPFLNNGQITVTGTGSNLQYSIDGGVTFQASNVFTGLSAGNYYVRIRNSVSGCFQDYASNPVVLNSMICTEICNNGIDDDGDGLADCLDSDCVPVPYAGSDVNICFGASHNLSASATGGVPPYTYNWDNGLGAGQNKTVSPVSTTVYHVTVTSASGCTAVDSVTVVVTVCPEDCTDGIDNDGDGLVDCDDPDCQATGKPQLMWDSYSVCPGTAFQEQVIFNDNNLQNAVFSIATPPNNGNVSINNSGVFTYSPYNNFCTNDRFVYRVCNQVTGCCDTASVFLVLHDTIPPSLVNVPPDITINCEDIVSAPPFVYGLDSCPGIYLSFEEESSQANAGACQSYTITRTWQATDLCGNTGVSSQVITVQDISPPELFRVYTLANGKKVAAGISKKNTNNWKFVKFPVNFSVKPLVFSQVITENELDAVTIRLRNVSTEGFEMRLQEQESSNGLHAGEEIAWMAIEPGALNDATKLQAGLITNVTHVAKLQNFSLPFASTPALVTTMQTFKDNNPVTMRISSLSVNSVQVFAEEERSADAEMTHNNEDAAYLAVKPGNIYDTENSFMAEAGVVTLTSGWTTVNLGRKYNKPVVIFGGLPADGVPATIRVRNLTDSSFQVRIQNWDYLSGTHGNLVASYLVAEGSVPAVTGYYCDPNKPSLTPGVNLFATDNCDGQITLNDSEYFTESASGLVAEYIWTATDDCGNSMQVSRKDTCSVVIVKIKTFLSGALTGSGNTGLMRDDLRTNGLIPFTEPYSQLTGFQHKGQGGGESITQDVLQVSGPDAIVDWVFVEIRDSSDSKKVLATRSALLQRDGDVIQADGSPFIIVSELVEGNYYVTLRHRNHLGMMSGAKVYLSAAAPLVDFRSSNVSVNGGLEGGKMMIDGNRAMWAGDMNGDRRVMFQGPNNDIFGLFSHVLADDLNIDFLANFISVGYHRTDFNLDGKIIYQGPNNDRSLLLYQTVLSHPGNVSNLANFIVLEKMP